MLRLRSLLLILLVNVLVFWSSLSHSLMVGPQEIFLEGPRVIPEGWVMKTASPYTLPGAVTLPKPVPEYYWWLGCSPTAAGMLFAYWDTHLGKTNLYDGDSSNWDKVNMNKDNQDHYDNEHNIVASWGHRQAGIAKGLSYGHWDRNNNNILDDQDQWDSLADFMRTQNGGTYRGNMAQGFIDYALWDNPATAVSESYTASSTTDWSPTWEEYLAEIDAGYPVHVGIPGHSILGFGYWTDPNTTIDYVINWTTWGGGLWGLIEFNEVYAFTDLRITKYIGTSVPEPACLFLLGSALIGFACLRRNFIRTK